MRVLPDSNKIQSWLAATPDKWLVTQTVLYCTVLHWTVLYSVRIDPVAHLRHYVTRTAELRDSEAMFVTMVRPHGSASKATLASWIQQVLAHSGQRGTGGSTRSTAASHAAHRGARLEDVLLAADWAAEWREQFSF